MRILVAIPVYNEQSTVEGVIRRVREHADHVLAVDDGSTDTTPAILNDLRAEMGLDLIRHEANAGYGRSVREAFRRASDRGFDWVITMDCDEQHEPAAIPAFVERCVANESDIVSGSRYLAASGAAGHAPPADRRAINGTITTELNERLGLALTDGFCGFKAHRVSAMDRLELTENGYAFPMQLWAQAAARGLRVEELPVELIYNDPNRTFGNGLDDAEIRLAHYRGVLDREIARVAHMMTEPAAADAGACSGCCR
ncbi:MAG: dolichyl-phosphate mannose synthase [Phycisphaeraceae bacterium]|nr:MAG: dolichyl-phosphate mannose synthase [Phycisphaeraceae bacterium]